MNITFTKIIFQIKSFFYNLIDSLKFSDKNNKNNKPNCYYNDENEIIIEDFETTYLFEMDPR